ncbi:MAG: hypothetical protein WHX53_11535 [Anaerolineae bacterium]
MDATDKPPADTDRAYLLRCWREGATWRFSLEPVRPRAQRRGFATLEAIFAFLQQEFGQKDRAEKADSV